MRSVEDKAVFLFLVLFPARNITKRMWESTSRSLAPAPLCTTFRKSCTKSPNPEQGQEQPTRWDRRRRVETNKTGYNERAFRKSDIRMWDYPDDMRLKATEMWACEGVYLAVARLCMGKCAHRLTSRHQSAAHLSANTQQLAVIFARQQVPRRSIRKGRKGDETSKGVWWWFSSGKQRRVGFACLFLMCFSCATMHLCSERRPDANVGTVLQVGVPGACFGLIDFWVWLSRPLPCTLRKNERHTCRTNPTAEATETARYLILSTRNGKEYIHPTASAQPTVPRQCRCTALPQNQHPHLTT